MQNGVVILGPSNGYLIVVFCNSGHSGALMGPSRGNYTAYTGVQAVIMNPWWTGQSNKFTKQTCWLCYYRASQDICTLTVAAFARSGCRFEHCSGRQASSTARSLGVMGRRVPAHHCSGAGEWYQDCSAPYCRHTHGGSRRWSGTVTCLLGNQHGVDPPAGDTRHGGHWHVNVSNK